MLAGVRTKAGAGGRAASVLLVWWVTAVGQICSTSSRRGNPKEHLSVRSQARAVGSHGTEGFRVAPWSGVRFVGTNMVCFGSSPFAGASLSLPLLFSSSTCVACTDYSEPLHLLIC